MAEGGEITFTLLCCTGWGKDGHIDGSYMQSFKCKNIHSDPYLFMSRSYINFKSTELFILQNLSNSAQKGSQRCWFT